jgi:hypothetical protein
VRRNNNAWQCVRFTDPARVIAGGSEQGCLTYLRSRHLPQHPRDLVFASDRLELLRRNHDHSFPLLLSDHVYATIHCRRLRGVPVLRALGICSRSGPNIHHLRVQHGARHRRV